MSKQRVILTSIIVIIIGVIGLIIYHSKGNELKPNVQMVSLLFTRHTSLKQVPFSNKPLKIIKTGYKAHEHKSGCKFTTSSAKNKKHLYRIPEDMHIPMTGEATIKGRIIVAETGKGLGRPVFVTLVDYDKEHKGEIRYSKTDINGNYEFIKVPHGRYKVGAGIYIEKWKTNYALNQQLTTIDVEVKAGKKVVSAPDIKIQLGGYITGRILRADGSGFKPGEVFNVCVYYKINGKDQFNCSGGMSGTKLGEDGSYIISNVPPIDNGYVKAQVYGYMNVKLPVPIKVEAGKTTSGIDITIPTNDRTGIKGIITDKKTGKPISGATVILDKYIPPDIKKKPGKNWPSEYQNAYDLGSAITNQKGKYFIKGVKPDNYTVFVMMYKYNAIHKEGIHGSIKISSNRQIKINLALSPESKNGGSTIEYVKDPTANINASCSSNTELIRDTFNKAITTMQTTACGLADTAYKNLDDKTIDIYCEPCGYDGWSYIGDTKIHLCTNSSGGFVSRYLEGTLFHESIHVAGYNENDAYAYAYACLRTGRVFYADSGLYPVFYLSQIRQFISTLD